MKKQDLKAQRTAQDDMGNLNPDLDEFAAHVQVRLVTFVYRKKNGRRRRAVGTTSLALIPPAYWPRGRRQTVSPAQGACFSYFDREEYDWRCFRIDLFEGFVDAPLPTTSGQDDLSD
jgi:hypothetical protein